VRGVARVDCWVLVCVQRLWKRLLALHSMLWKGRGVPQSLLPLGGRDNNRNRPAAAGVVVGKTASTELSERAKDKAAGQKEQARGGQRPRARAWQPGALITNSRCKMFASPSRGARDRTQQSSTQRGPLSHFRILIAIGLLASRRSDLSSQRIATLPAVVPTASPHAFVRLCRS